ncbi:hypothetical protein ACHLL9_14055, partial [Staphylococcus aureus]
DLMIDPRFIEMTLERHPHLKNNFYGLIDGKEFKLD